MDYHGVDEATCPFCPFTDHDSTFVAEHIEHCHPENQAEPAPLTTTSSEEFQKYLDCPRGCGELVADTELSTHLDLHLAEGIALEGAYLSGKNPTSLSHEADTFNAPDKYPFLDDGPAYSTKRQSSKGESRQESSSKGFKFRGMPLAKPDSKTPRKGLIERLGRAELGPYAHEKQMPVWLRKMLEKGARLSTSNIIGPDGKLQKQQTVENETIGIIAVLSQLWYETFSDSMPTILQLQSMIENAWDMGFNSIGRLETGGIRGTRKYIGTPEGYDVKQAALRQQINLKLMMLYSQTSLPIFDQPSPQIKTKRPSSAVTRLKGPHLVPSNPGRILSSYRRGAAYLQKYKIFEILKLSVPSVPSEP
ncbi:hypothetical protein FE257_004369 [Aspergillus nanangensis]|uniref:UFSP1/2/DUB catalytic domain-containing protein n=1 Tax=Aspergillus nanangensis TaxID=2582783 RepID=A0AAD4CAP7_ASPNN|nr:hypothetical protein FE257_004369 [Aspergillus nanangensis]